MKLDTALIEELFESSISSYQIAKNTGISRQMIGKLRNGQADFRKGSLENALTLYQFAHKQKEAGRLNKRIETQYKEACTKEDLLEALKVQTDEILVSGPLAVEINELKKSQLSETETMGVYLGSRGVLAIVDYLISTHLDTDKTLDKEERKIRKHIIRLYEIKKMTKSSVLLRLKQLDY